MKPSKPPTRKVRSEPSCSPGGTGSAPPRVVADLFDLAVRSDPVINIGEGSERSQRTRFGMLLPKVRDRVFQIAYRKVRVELGPVAHNARKWRLQVMAGPDEFDQARDSGPAGNLGADGEPLVRRFPS